MDGQVNPCQAREGTGKNIQKQQNRSPRHVGNLQHVYIPAWRLHTSMTVRTP